MNFVIGDIHGEITKLKSLINNISIIDQNPSLIFIGDYIDKGEDSYQTLKFLQELSRNFSCIFLRGNHEYCWEKLEGDPETAEYLLKYGAKDTISSVDPAKDIYEVSAILFSEFKDFFNKLQNYYIVDDFLVVHSGLKPEFYAMEMETIPVEKMIFNRYDFISYPELYHGKRIIFGHTGFLYPFYDGVKIGLDTAACYIENQPLTGFCTDKEFFIDSNNSICNLNSLDLSCCPIIPRLKPWRANS